MERVKGAEVFIKHGVFGVFMIAGVQVGVQKRFPIVSVSYRVGRGDAAFALREIVDTEVLDISCRGYWFQRLQPFCPAHRRAGGAIGSGAVRILTLVEDEIVLFGGATGARTHDQGNMSWLDTL